MIPDHTASHDGPQLRVLLREHEQHGVIKEAVDGHVIAHALAPPCLNHELARQGTHRRRLQGPQHHRLIQWVARHHLPVVEHGLAERLALGGVAQVSFETEGLDDREVGLDEEDGSAWGVWVAGGKTRMAHMSSSPYVSMASDMDARPSQGGTMRHT